jgi:hypothetical protein
MVVFTPGVPRETVNSALVRMNSSKPTISQPNLSPSQAMVMPRCSKPSWRSMSSLNTNSLVASLRGSTVMAVARLVLNLFVIAARSVLITIYVRYRNILYHCFESPFLSPAQLSSAFVSLMALENSFLLLLSSVTVQGTLDSSWVLPWLFLTRKSDRVHWEEAKGEQQGSQKQVPVVG